MIVYTDISENSAMARAAFVFSTTDATKIWITFRRKNKLFYTTDYKPKMYKRILIAELNKDIL